MKHFDTHSHIVWLIIMLLLSSCMPQPLPIAPIVDGEVVSLYSGTARYVAQQAMAGAPNAETFAKESYILMARYLEDGMAFTAVNSTTAEAAIAQAEQVGGNLVNLRTWKEFREWLLANGWQSVSPGIVASWSWLTNVANTAMPTFYLVPSGFDYTQEKLDQMYGGVDQ